MRKHPLTVSEDVAAHARLVTATAEGRQHEICRLPLQHSPKPEPVATHSRGATYRAGEVLVHEAQLTGDLDLLAVEVLRVDGKLGPGGSSSGGRARGENLREYGAMAMNEARLVPSARRTAALVG